MIFETVKWLAINWACYLLCTITAINLLVWFDMFKHAKRLLKSL